jgi:hypothetical protein
LPETDRKRKLPPSSATTGAYWKKPRFENSDQVSEESQGIRRTDRSISSTPSPYQKYKTVAVMPNLVWRVIFVTKANQHDLYCLHPEIPVGVV